MNILAIFTVLTGFTLVNADVQIEEFKTPLFCTGYINHALQSNDFDLNEPVFRELEKQTLLLLKTTLALKKIKPNHKIPMSVPIHKIMNDSKMIYMQDRSAPDAEFRITSNYSTCLTIMHDLPTKLGLHEI